MNNINPCQSYTRRSQQASKQISKEMYAWLKPNNEWKVACMYHWGRGGDSFFFFLLLLFFRFVCSMCWWWWRCCCYCCLVCIDFSLVVKYQVTISLLCLYTHTSSETSSRELYINVSEKRHHTTHRMLTEWNDSVHPRPQSSSRFLSWHGSI